jgi:hypothetical protein
MNSPNTTGAVNAALELAARGYPVFPARLCRAACLKCSVCKAPATPHGFKDASTEAAEIQRLWRDHYGALIGVPTGAVSGFDALDIDLSRHQTARNWWRQNRERIPHTRVYATGSGGLHLLFQHSDLVRCSAGKIARGVDTRGLGGFVVWWPAYGCSILSDVAPAPWPEWLLAEFRPKPIAASRLLAPVPNSRLLAKLVQMVAAAHEGERNCLTFWCACRAGEMVAAGRINAGTAVAVIAEAATRAGLPRAEAERTARSGVVAGGGNG